MEKQRYQNPKSSFLEMELEYDSLIVNSPGGWIDDLWDQGGSGDPWAGEDD